MKLIQSNPTQRQSESNSPGWLPTMRLLLALSLMLPVFQAGTETARGELSEPDNIVYGTIVIGPDVITADRFDVVIEARRTADGPAIASYRMGTETGYGDFYALRIPVEATGPTVNTNASLAGTQLFIVVRDNAGIQGQGTYTIPERGHVQRVNFGAAVEDTDGNGLPDDWEIANFGGNAQDPNGDPDGDGQSTLNEWIAGTNPNDADDHFKLNVTRAGNQTEVSFVALRAEGPGYLNRTRIYSLLSTTNLTLGTFNTLPGYTEVVGNNQTIQIQVPLGVEISEFFKGEVRLEE